MTKQRRLQHVVRNGCTVDRNKRLRGAGRLLMNVARQHLLAGTRLTRDEHRRIAGGYASGQLKQLNAGRLNRNRAVRSRCQLP